MKIANYNVNGVNGRLPVLLRWLTETEPDIVCLQELKAPDEKFPKKALKDLGYDAIWHGQKSWNGVAILSRVGAIHETRRGLPGDPDVTQSRYIEAPVAGIIIGGLYLPNGNPKPGPKFDYKLRWFDRLIAYAADLLASGLPVMLAGDFNVMPTELDVYKPERWLDDACSLPRCEPPTQSCSSKGGPMPCARRIRVRRSTHFGTTSGRRSRETRVSASITSCLARRSLRGLTMRRSTGMCAAGRRRVTMLLCG